MDDLSLKVVRKGSWLIALFLHFRLYRPARLQAFNRTNHDPALFFQEHDHPSPLIPYQPSTGSSTRRSSQGA